MLNICSVKVIVNRLLKLSFLHDKLRIKTFCGNGVLTLFYYLNPKRFQISHNCAPWTATIVDLISGFVLLCRSVPYWYRWKSLTWSVNKNSSGPAVKIYFPNKRSFFTLLVESQLAMAGWQGNFSHYCTLIQKYSYFVKNRIYSKISTLTTVALWVVLFSLRNNVKFMFGFPRKPTIFSMSVHSSNSKNGFGTFSMSENPKNSVCLCWCVCYAPAHIRRCRWFVSSGRGHRRGTTGTAPSPAGDELIYFWGILPRQPHKIKWKRFPRI